MKGCWRNIMSLVYRPPDSLRENVGKCPRQSKIEPTVGLNANAALFDAA
jgi:hypothetical protein